MKRINGVENFKAKQPTITTIGTFDGVHLGHQKILSKLVEEGKKSNLETIVLTFSPHPRKVLNPKLKLYQLNTANEKMELFKKSGIDNLIIQKFDKVFSEFSANRFVKNIIVGKLNVRKILIGYDHRFGKNREAGIEELTILAKKYDFEIIEINAEEKNNISISSTKIRNALKEGDLSTVKSYLGYDYRISGKIIKGNSIGRKIGFPTANLQLVDKEKLIPKRGVYLVYTTLENKLIHGMMNIGIKPTLKKAKESIEVNLFGWEKNIYGKHIDVFLKKFIRDERKFVSLEKLSEQLKSDKGTCLKLLNEK
ncbi:MAG: riboflavin biosynthesis protein RibF [Flavobacteriaceae bacterium]|nr:riboflavin biosynthesis protein RibF [Flavobacteriaceae bacterium]